MGIRGMTVIAFLFVFLSLFFMGCNFHIDSQKLNVNPLSPVTAQQLNSFEALKTNILDPKCLRCHSSATKTEGHVDLSTYATIMQKPGLVSVGHSSTSHLYTEVQSGDMPDEAPALSPTEVAAIKEWIDSGAPNGEFTNSDPSPVLPTPTPVSPPPVNPVPTPVTNTYQTIQTQIFNQTCVKCHSGPKPKGKVDLSSYQSFMATTDPKTVYDDISTGDMPPRGASVDAKLVLILRAWIDDGAKNN